MDAEYYHDRYEDEKAEWFEFYRENMKLSDDEVLANCFELKKELSKGDIPDIVLSILNYYNQNQFISEKQRNVLVRFLTNIDQQWS